MNNQGDDPFVKRDLGCVCLLAGPFKRDYNIADHFTREIRDAGYMPGKGCRRVIAGDVLKIRKRYDVGRLVPSEELPVVFPYLCIVDKEDAYVLIL